MDKTRQSFQIGEVTPTTPKLGPMMVFLHLGESLPPPIKCRFNRITPSSAPVLAVDATIASENCWVDLWPSGSMRMTLKVQAYTATGNEKLLVSKKEAHIEKAGGTLDAAVPTTELTKNDDAKKEAELRLILASLLPGQEEATTETELSDPPTSVRGVTFELLPRTVEPALGPVVGDQRKELKQLKRLLLNTFIDADAALGGSSDLAQLAHLFRLQPVLSILQDAGAARKIMDFMKAFEVLYERIGSGRARLADLFGILRRLASEQRDDNPPSSLSASPAEFQARRRGRWERSKAAWEEALTLLERLKSDLDQAEHLARTAPPVQPQLPLRFGAQANVKDLRLSDLDGFLQSLNELRRRREELLGAFLSNVTGELSAFQMINSRYNQLTSKALDPLIRSGHDDLNNINDSLQTGQAELARLTASLAVSDERVTCILDESARLAQSVGDTRDNIAPLKAVISSYMSSSNLRQKFATDLDEKQRSLLALEATLRKDLRRLRELDLESGRYLGLGFTEISQASQRLSERVTRLYRNLTLADFNNKVQLAESVWKCEDAEGSLLVLKRFPFDASNRFKKEAEALVRLVHPLIIPIRSIFLDTSSGDTYIVLPFVAGGDLKAALFGPQAVVPSSGAPLSQRLTSKLSPIEIQSIFRQILQAIAFFHREGFVHRDLKLSNILVDYRPGGSPKPLVADFDVSKDVRSDLTTTHGSKVGTAEVSLLPLSHIPLISVQFMSPEVEQKKKATPASDMWSFGVMVYIANFGTYPPPLLTGDTVSIPAHPNQALVNVLQLLLHREPTRRLEAEMALLHPYFQAPASVSSNLSSDSAVAALEKQLTTIREPLDRGGNVFRSFRGLFSNEVSLDPTKVVESATNWIVALDPKNILNAVNINFKGEAAIDLGGVTTALFARFFTEFNEMHLQSVGGSKSALDFLLPRPDADANAFYAAGVLMVRAVASHRFVATRFAPYIYDWILCGRAVTLYDCDLVDPESAGMYRHLLASTVDAAQMDLDFAGLKPGGDKISVTDGNKYQYVELILQDRFVKRFLPQLEALRRGLFAYEPLVASLKALTGNNLRSLLNGNEYFSGDELIEQVMFDAAQASQVPSFVEKFLLTADESTARAFLCFATARLSLPLPQKIVVQVNPALKEASLPSAKTCFCRIIFPEYSTYELFKTKTLTALFETGQEMHLK